MTSGLLVDLSRRAVLAVTGLDTQKFLQSLVTCDIKRVNATTSSLGAFTSPNGRVIATFRIAQSGDGYLMWLPAELAAATTEHLRKFVFRAKVQIADVTQTTLRVGLTGDGAEALLVQLAGAAPAAVDAVQSLAGGFAVRVHGAAPRFELIGEGLAALIAALRVETDAGVEGAWDLLDIEAGVANVHAPTAEAFLPQNLDLERTGALSFSKGCYPGQEVVARTQYLGSVKRRLFRAEIGQAAAAPERGTALVTAGEERERDAGKVVDAQRAPDGRVRLLAVMPVELVEAQVPIRCADTRLDVSGVVPAAV